MPELSASGNVFSLDAQAGFDEGVVRGRVGAGARLTFQGQLELCHGLDAALTAEVAAQLHAALTLFFLFAARGEGEALAAAGVKVAGRVYTDVFDTVGFSAEAAAFAEAAVAGRLAIGLDWRDVARLARGQLPGVAYDIFIAFLNETVIEAGVWGKAAFAAMAQAHLNVRGSLRDDADAGFVVEMGADVGLGAGAGFEFFGGIRFTNPKRFYLTAVERITAELVAAARHLLPAHLRPEAELLELVLPITLNAAYELGQKAVLQTLAPSAELVTPLNDNFAAQLQRFLLDKAAQAGERWLANVLGEAAERAAAVVVDDALRGSLKGLVDGLVADLSAQPLTVERLVPLLPRLADLLTGLLPHEEVERWRRPLAILWCALAAGEALRQSVGAASASASAGMVGLGTVVARAAALQLPPAPNLVLEEMAASWGEMPGEPHFPDALDYLLDVGIAPLLRDLSPDLALLLSLFEQKTGITAGTLIETSLRGTFGEGFAATDLYTRLRELLRDTIHGHIARDLMPALRTALPPGNDTRLWLDEVAEPSLLAIAGFVLEQLDALVSGGVSAAGSSTWTNTLRSGLSTLVGKVVVRNVVVVADILLSHGVGGLHDAFEGLEKAVRDDSRHVLATSAQVLAPALLPPLAPLPPGLAEATRALVADLSAAGADAFGPGVWTAERHERLRELLRRLLLSIDGTLDYHDASAVTNFFRQLAECAYIPDPDGVVSLAGLLAEVTGDELAILLPAVSSALTAFFLRLTLESVEAMAEAAHRFVDQVAEAVRRAWEAFQEWRAELQRRIEQAQAAARALADRLDEAAELLRAPARRQDVLDRLMLDGLTEADRRARGIPGFDLLPVDGQNLAISAATGAFVVAFNLVRPALDLGLQAIAGLGDDLASLVRHAADLPDLLDDLGRKAEQQVKDAVNAALGVFGVALPAELSIDQVADAAHAALDALGPLRQALEAALVAQEAEHAARQREADARARKAEARRRWREQRDLQREQLGEEIHIDILSPVALAPRAEDNLAYGPGLVALVRVRGARPSFVRADSPRRVLLALNSQALVVPPADWSYNGTGGALVLRTLLTPANAPLRAGLNAFECTVADGVETITRQVVLFAVNPNLPPAGSVAVEPALSLFDTPMNDHERVEQERVAFRNTGNLPLRLAGWRVRDRASHTYVFPDIEVLPGATITLHTGRGTDTASDLYWGRRQAVWNNRGDAVYLLDPHGVVQAEYLYGTEA